MCIGGNNNTSNASAQADPRAFFKYWRPPEITQPTMKLNEEATKDGKSNTRQGIKRLQIPLTPAKTSQGLSIPTSKGGL